MAQTWAIVVAAGEGKRFGADRPKAFVGFQGDVLLKRAITLIEDHDDVHRMVLVVPAGWEDPAQLLADQMVAGKVASVIAGGATRAESVAAGLAELPDTADLVLVHDAARPLGLARSGHAGAGGAHRCRRRRSGPAGVRHDQAHRRRGGLLHARTRRPGGGADTPGFSGRLSAASLRSALWRSCTPLPTARPCSRTRACGWCGCRASGRISRSPSRTTCAWPRPWHERRSPCRHRLRRARVRRRACAGAGRVSRSPTPAAWSATLMPTWCATRSPTHCWERPAARISARSFPQTIRRSRAPRHWSSCGSRGRPWRRRAGRSETSTRS